MNGPHIQVMTQLSSKKLIEQDLLKISEKLTVIMIFTAIFLLYIATLAPTIPSGDSGELITSAYTLGISHPPGYPLFNLLGKLFSLLPIGTVAWRINLSAAVFNLTATILIYLTLVKLIKYWPSALLGAVFCALSPIIWEYSLKAEVFSLNNLFSALILYLLITLRDYHGQYKTQQIDNNQFKKKYMIIITLLSLSCGLALTNHHTIVLLTPLVSIFLLSYNQHVSKYQTVVIFLTAFMIGLSIYSYIPIRALANPYLNWDNPKTITGFLTLITRADYGTFKLIGGYSITYSLLEKYGIYVLSLIKQFNPLGIILAFLGMIFLIKHKEKSLTISLFLTFILTSFIFFILANIPRNNLIYLGVFERFYLLPAIFVALFIGLGHYYLYYCSTHFCQKKQYWYPITTGIIIASLVISTISNFPKVNQHNASLVYYYGWDILNSIEKNAIVLARGDTANNVLTYLQLVEQSRPDLIIIDQERLTYSWYCQQLKKRYPAIILPFKNYDGQHLSQLIDANSARPIYIVGGLKETSIFLHYRIMPMGLVKKVVTKDFWPNKEEYINNNKHIWYQYHLSELKNTYSKTSFENEIIQDYALSRSYLATEYLRMGLFDLAISEYKHSIKINPILSYPYKNLGVIYARFKHQTNNAVYYWKTYIRLNPTDKDNKIIMAFIKMIDHSFKGSA